MSTNTQLNIRIDPELKRRGDVVLARAGIGSSEAVRALWTHVAETQSIPEVLLDTGQKEKKDRLQLIRESAGLARRFAQEMGIVLRDEPLDINALMDDYYDDYLDRMEENHA